MSLDSIPFRNKTNIVFPIRGGSRPLTTRTTARDAAAILRLVDPLKQAVRDIVATVTEDDMGHSEFLDSSLFSMALQTTSASYELPSGQIYYRTRPK
jgi:hypothetical protein